MSLELLLVISQKAFIIFSRIDTCVFNSFKMETSNISVILSKVVLCLNWLNQLTGNCKESVFSSFILYAPDIFFLLLVKKRFIRRISSHCASTCRFTSVNKSWILPIFLLFSSLFFSLISSSLFLILPTTSSSIIISSGNKSGNKLAINSLKSWLVSNLYCSFGMKPFTILVY